MSSHISYRPAESYPENRSDGQTNRPTASCAERQVSDEFPPLKYIGVSSQLRPLMAGCRRMAHQNLRQQSVLKRSIAAASRLFSCQRLVSTNFCLSCCSAH